jgi:hypothetical protein
MDYTSDERGREEVNDDIVERVAKAIAETGNGGQWDNETFYKPEHREFHRRRARAAIEAIAASHEIAEVRRRLKLLANENTIAYDAIDFLNEALGTPTDG